ncbi:DUF4382 domain-containing protein [Mucilaginibacter sp. RB4R14]|uniref:DUF4382 domain-containing protein n=1 Tax=Mucilaginibacter aurantiaciroseus TaxID=2949308 RepID=UPI002091DF16|nr:DUF4382 domain-containing protein [Mucilaginibacter aurantiaciroseus]MCO5937435.1 DUF4382 domain-containing protein [Mucilaginibacter aurantiaciroseus]
MMNKIILFSVVILALGFASCKKSNSSNTTPLSVRLTDGPGPYDAVILSVKQVVVITTGGQQTLDVNGGPIDILHFRLGKDTLLAATDIPSGQLQEVRLVLNTTGNKVIVNGISHDLTTPSGQTSGVKLKVMDNLTAGIAYTLLLDFDAGQSIVTTGSGKYILKPVIRAISQAVSGAITGLVIPIAAYPKVYAINGTDTVSTIADGTGKFYFPGMPAATYSVNFIPVSPYAVKTISNVVVVKGGVKDIGTVTFP